MRVKFEMGCFSPPVKIAKGTPKTKTYSHN